MTLKKAFIPEPLPRFKACYTCKARKVRCDGVHPICQTCFKHYQSRGISPIPLCTYQDKSTCIKERREKKALKEASKISTSTSGSSSTISSSSTSEPFKVETDEEDGHCHSPVTTISDHELTMADEVWSNGGLAMSDFESVATGSDVNANNRLRSVPDSKSCCNSSTRAVDLQSRVASLEALVNVQFSTISSLRSELELYRSKYPAVSTPPTVSLSSVLELNGSSILSSPSSSISSSSHSRQSSHFSINSQEGIESTKAGNFTSWDFLPSQPTLTLQSNYQPSTSPSSIQNHDRQIDQLQTPQNPYLFLSPLQIQFLQQQQIFNTIQQSSNLTNPDVGSLFGTPGF